MVYATETREGTDKSVLWGAEGSLLNKAIEKKNWLIKEEGRGKEEEEEYSEPQCKVK